MSAARGFAGPALRSRERPSRHSRSFEMAEQEKTPPAPAPGQAAPPQAPLDFTDVVSSYTNWYQVTGTAEELILDFGLTPHLGVVTEDPIRVRQRLVMSFYTAKRLLAHL